MITVFK